MVAELAKKVELLDLPPETGAHLKAISNGCSLRGKVLQFQRETANIRSRLIVDIVDDYDLPEKIPAEVDPTPTLMKIWGIRE